MLETEFIRSMQSNYERIHLSEKPDDKRYQYCILTRGGIKGLLPCSLRYINGQAYLYYDITSRQNVAQWCAKQMIDRQWILDFFWSLNQTRLELGRFLLDSKNIMLYPEQIFQDIGNRNFFFLYLPYNQDESGVNRLLEFLLEHMDYEDEKLVECIYSMYEQYEKLGDTYLQNKIFEDANCLNEDGAGEEAVCTKEEGIESAPEDLNISTTEGIAGERVSPRKSIWDLLNGRKKKAEEQRIRYMEDMKEVMEGAAVAEDPVYDEYSGSTIYMEQPVINQVVHKLYTPDGRVAAWLEGDSLIVGKHREEVNLVLEDESVSRVHARIYKEGNNVFLEDLNSTNGTFKNGLRLQPYEKRHLEEDDEIRIGNLLFVYR